MESFPTPIRISDIIDEWLEAQSRETIREVGRYWASDADTCLRQSVWKFSEPVHEKFKASRQGNWSTGILIEEWVGRILAWAKDQGKFDYAVPQRSFSFVADWENDIQVTGKSDYLFKLFTRGNDDFQLLEVKTIANVDKIDAPLRHHVMQVMPYIYVLKPTFTSILYIERDNLANKKEFFVEYDPLIMNYVFERAKKLDNFLKTGEIPIAEAKYCPKCKGAKLVVVHTTRPKTATCPNCKTVYSGEEIKEETNLWQCGYCPYREKCDLMEAERDKNSQ